MQQITNTVRNSGFVNDYCLRQSPTENQATLVVYLHPGVCSNDEKRQQALNNLCNKIDDLNGVEVAKNDITGRYATQQGITRQERGILGSIRLEKP